MTLRCQGVGQVLRALYDHKVLGRGGEAFHLSCKIIRSWVGMFRLWRIIIRSQGVDEVFRLSHMTIGSKGEGDDMFCICLFFKYFL